MVSLTKEELLVEQYLSSDDTGEVLKEKTAFILQYANDEQLRRCGIVRVGINKFRALKAGEAEGQTW